MEKQLTAGTNISLKNWIRNKLQENEEMHDYAVATETVRCWIDEHEQLSQPTEPATEKEPVRIPTRDEIYAKGSEYADSQSNGEINAYYDGYTTCLNDFSAYFSPVSTTIKDGFEKWLQERIANAKESYSDNEFNFYGQVLDTYRQFSPVSQTKGLDITDEEIIELMINEIGNTYNIIENPDKGNQAFSLISNKIVTSKELAETFEKQGYLSLSSNDKQEKIPLNKITDDVLNEIGIICMWTHLSKGSRVEQARQLMSVWDRRVTNLHGDQWLKIFQLLELNGYDVPVYYPEKKGESNEK